MIKKEFSNIKNLPASELLAKKPMEKLILWLIIGVALLVIIVLAVNNFTKKSVYFTGEQLQLVCPKPYSSRNDCSIETVVSDGNQISLIKFNSAGIYVVGISTDCDWTSIGNYPTCEVLGNDNQIYDIFDPEIPIDDLL
ncbi:hypothetical protein GX888_01975 [Candidatus Dojkabacteria bacterium]|uniref:Uncharacterized protein n=1 Tax=Candidatus Dojkabacteria bacterium TaxID=2099670 RepID=A0A847VDJ1_9BACT|nr:hypothetical protein [Candidatus Dojkabacteria bacterium]